MLQLKNYQKRAIGALKFFFQRCRDGQNIEKAYQEALQELNLRAAAYRSYCFNQIPYVCIRIPTGGGKTLLGSYAITVAAHDFLGQDYPLVLWLVPTNTIRQQTVEALKTSGHPYREQLDQAFNREVRVLDIEEVDQIRPQDLGTKAIVVVSTLANLRVNDTSSRKVYAYREDFEPHFARLPANTLDNALLEKVSYSDLQENGLKLEAVGRIKYSFANLLAVYRPILIMDEAHNARTPLTFETLLRVHPATIIEFTATPNMSETNGSNILYHVSASELKAEEMIKLPILLTEHAHWQDAIRDAMLTRNRLAEEAKKDQDYIRPMVLLQAEDKSREVTVDVLKSYLVNELKIGVEKIAVVTGNQRELDQVNLFLPTCPIEYVITIEALKEGWDCSFAYIFCSVKQVSSSKDAEQLLGRVLRMPYARRRVIEDLNRAYAHLASSSFSKAAHELADKLIAMGFEELEVASFLRPQNSSSMQTDFLQDAQNAQGNRPIFQPSFKIELERKPDITTLTEDEKPKFSVVEYGERTEVHTCYKISENMENVLYQVIKREDRPALEKQIKLHNQMIDSAHTPAASGVPFAPLPQLCVLRQGELELVEKELLLKDGQWSLLDYPAELRNFSISETENSFCIDVEGKKVIYGLADQSEIINLNDSLSTITENDLIGWLDQEIRDRRELQKEKISFLSGVIRDLIQAKQISLTTLLRHKYPLAKAIRDLIASYEKKACKKGYQKLRSDDSIQTTLDCGGYIFRPDSYPARPPYYSGAYQFKRHYYDKIEDIKSEGEEFECAKILDSLVTVKHWVRNLVRRDQASFSLPLAQQHSFYPDFIAELQDGRILVVEYKGDAYASNDDSREKCEVGDLWAKKSQGKCLFHMAVKKDTHGRSIAQQLRAIIDKKEVAIHES